MTNEELQALIDKWSDPKLDWHPPYLYDRTQMEVDMRHDLLKIAGALQEYLRRETARQIEKGEKKNGLA